MKIACLKNRSFYVLAVFPLLLFLAVEAVSQMNLLAGFKVIVASPLYFLVTLLFFTGCTFLLFYLSKRPVFTLVCVSPMFLLYAFAGAVKSSIRELPIVPANFYYLKEIKFIVNFSPVVVALSAGLILLIVIALIFLFKKTKKEPLSGKKRLTGITAGVLMGFIAFWLITSVLPVQNDSLLGKYKKQGCIPTLFQYVVKPWMEQPQPLSQEKQDQIKNEVSNYFASQDQSKTPDVIVFTMESFVDPYWFKNVQYDIDPVENLHKLSSGRAIVSSYGGNSTGTEYEVLSGDCTAFLQPDSAAFQDFLKKDLPYAYPSMLKNNGYSTAVVCPVESFFLNSKEGYKMLGLDKGVYKENFNVEKEFDVDRGQNDAYTDYEVSRQVIKTYEEMLSENKPILLYANTFENHYPFDLQKFIDSGRVKVSLTKVPDELSKKDIERLTAYIQGVYYADKCIATLMEYFKNSSRDTVIVIYGDHLGGLGSGIDYYQKLGIMSEGEKGSYTYEQLRQVHTVPYFIWDNFSGNVPKAPSQPIAMSNLLPFVFQQYGIKMHEGAQFLSYASQYLSDYGLQQWPEYDRGLSQQQKDLIAYYRQIQYTRMFG